MARLREAGYFDRDPEMELFEYEYSGYMLQLIGHFVKMIRKLAETYPDVNILIRPHPVEDEDAWDKMIGPFPNVHVFRDGTISGWIRGAKAIIHNGCTSALEAAVSGVPRIAYRPLPSHFEREIPNQLSHEAFSIDEMIEKVNHALEGKFSKAEIKHDNDAHKKLIKRLVNVEGILGADRIVTSWESLENVISNDSSSLLTIESITSKVGHNSNESHLPGILARIKQLGKSLVLPNETKTESAPEQLLDNSFKFKTFTDEEIFTIKENLTRTTGRFESVHIQRVSSRAFLLSSGK